MVRKLKIVCSLLATMVAAGVVLQLFDTSIAHSISLPGALSLPACHSRSLSCEPPPESGVQDAGEQSTEYTLQDGHCRDGLGTSQGCEADGLFPYLDLIAVEGQDNEPTFILAERDALYDEACKDGFAGPFPCENIDLLALLPLSDVGGGRGSDIWGWTDPETGGEFALMGRDSGTSFIDITSPISPTYLGELPSHSRTAPWRDLKVYKDHAFIVADYNRSHGMQIFDLQQLSDAVPPTSVLTSTAPYTPTVFAATAHYDGFDRAHNIAINEESGYAYTIGGETCDSGPHIINIQDPTDPQYVGCYNDGDYTHDAQCVRYRGPDLVYNGREICFNSTVETLTIVDVTDKQNQRLLAKVDSSGYDFDFAYFHQSWLTEDQRYLLSDDELDESKFGHNARTYIWDVSDLHAPTIIGLYTADVVSIDHNLYIRGNYVFEANYTSGLRIFSLENIAKGELTEVAHLDTLPEADLRTTGSAWSVYPYFESGTVVVSSIEDGLFVLRPNLPPEFSARAKDNVLDYCMSSSTVLTDSVVTFANAVELSAYNNYSGTIQLNVEPTNSAVVLSATQAVLRGNGDSAIDIKLDLEGFSEGIHTFEVELTDSLKATSLSYEFGLHSAVPDVVTFGGISDAGTLPNTLSWQPAFGAVDYLIEISRDPDFATVDYSRRTRSTAISLPNLLDTDQQHFWRVQALNGCGTSVFTDGQAIRNMVAIYLPVIE